MAEPVFMLNIDLSAHIKPIFPLKLWRDGLELEKISEEK
jgi:hypothetical protein